MGHPSRFLMVVSLCGAIAGCGGADGEDSAVPDGSLAEEERVPCAESGSVAQTTDVNGDQIGDIRHVFEGQQRICSEFDMNFDGRIDITRFYEPDGQTTAREEHDLDFDGRLDRLSFYENGVLVRKELDTNFDNVMDVWMWCGEGLVQRAERDRRNNGSPDTWEDYTNGYLVEARYDDNNDGNPERWEEFTAGRLSKVRYDTTGDGEVDREEEIPRDESGPPDEPIGCDGRPLTEPPLRPEDQPSTDEATTGEPETDENAEGAEDGLEGTGEGEPFGTGTGTEPVPDGETTGDESADADQEESP